MTANPPKLLQPIKPGIWGTWRLLRRSYNNPLEHARELRKDYGDVVMQKMFGMTYVHLMGADAAKLMLVNESQVFSNKKAWDMIIGRIFTNGLMLRDGDDHRYHRRIMQAGFKATALQRYMQEMVPQVETAVAELEADASGKLLAFPAFKHMTLDLAATIFLGMDLGAEASKISKAFEDTVAASMPRIPWAVPGTILWRGIRARKYIIDYLLREIPAKRSGAGTDMFSLLCRAEDEDGNQYTDQEVADHMLFLMMAAHDTTTSTLTSMTYALARHPEWQERLREEARGLQLEHLDYAHLDGLPLVERVMKEALRMYPPLSTLPKYSLNAFEYAGYTVPANSMIATYPIHTHYMEEYWPEPTRFDPERFSEGRAEQKNHPYCWIPFSGGAHMCIGLHFAIMQVKLVMFEMLKQYQWSVPEGYTMPVQQSPISKPRDDLPITLKPLQSD
ncbi:cytochrome P450 [Halieaceae bacterium IMCC14734]|uniref:Cytochrome P450 n=1 Tax=Candidatus Litorirhabdus singularis TaxID=2518993 RepID=A0ABT3TJU0_9GAMM|nr:cytochrome P450 [Candidatus Litorirhabdus singularis]MCX2982578.1 cytochrome P450 [Candidatus Litorirhabdus singularis]